MRRRASRAPAVVGSIFVGPIVVGVVGAALLGGVSCSRSDSLVLLDLRRSGPLGEPVARVRLSASGWPTRTVTTASGDIGPDGFRVGYYGPGKGDAVSVTAEALDAVDCVLGSGSATVAKLTAGATSDPLTLFIRPLPANNCVPDAGMPDAGDDGGDDGGTDAGMDAAPDGTDGPADGTDAGDDTATDAGTDVGSDSAADAMGDLGDDGGGDGATADTSSD